MCFSPVGSGLLALGFCPVFTAIHSSWLFTVDFWSVKPRLFGVGLGLLALGEWDVGTQLHQIGLFHVAGGLWEFRLFLVLAAIFASWKYHLCGESDSHGVLSFSGRFSSSGLNSVTAAI